MTSVSRNGFDIIVVVLGADTKKIRTSDSVKLIEYIYKNYELVDLKELVKDEFEAWRKINEKRISIYKGVKQTIETTLGELKYTKYPVDKDNVDNIWMDINFRDYFEAPVEENTKIGNMKIGINTTEIMDVEILVRNKINRKNVMYYFMELMRKYKISYIQHQSFT